MLCNCCGSDDVGELGAYMDYRHLRCAGCGHENFVRRNAGIAAELYENDADYIDDLNVWTSPDDLVLWHHVKAIEVLRSRNPAGKATALDVGCFNGFFVQKLLELGYDAHGVDFNKKAVAYGREQLGLGSRVSSQSLRELFEEGWRFDVVTIFEVLEHLPDAKTFLGEVGRLLNDEGVLIISTPNSRMCWRPSLDYPPHHLSRFTTKSLEGHLRQIGVEPFYAAEQMSTYELVRHYAGTFFRAKNSASLRGGEFRNKKITTLLRRGVNRLRRASGVLLWPLDRILHLFGVRYISQIVVGEKRAIAR